MKSLRPVLLLAALAHPSPASRAAQDGVPRPYNLVVVVLDSLRPDHMGAYGYPRPTTPSLDRIAGEGIVFQRAFTQAVDCLHAYASLLASRYPGPGRLHPGGRPEDVSTLPGALRAEGYDTAAFVAGAFPSPEKGLRRGFDLYRHPGGGQGEEGSLSQALGWLRDRRDERPFFLFLNFMDLHPAAAAGYDDALSRADSALGRLRRALEERGLWKDTVLAVLSDHGKGLGERRNGRGALYDETLRIAWVLRHPDPALRSRRVQRAAELVDVAPTLLGLLGVGPPPGFEGRNLGPWLRAFEDAPLPPPDRPSFAAHLEPSGHDAVVQGRSVRHGDLKLVWRRGAGLELYDTGQDPGETRNLAGPEAARGAALMRSLLDHLETLAAPPARAPGHGLPPEAIEGLRRMGYILQ